MPINQQSKQNVTSRKRKHDAVATSSVPHLVAVCLDYQWVVVDTNCFLDSISVICSLKDWNLHVVVPFIVVQELDGLKNRKDSVGSQARVAISALQPLIDSDKYRFVGQGMNQSFIDYTRFFAKKAISPDDRVLDCAIWFNSNGSSKDNVVLVTKDKALALKAKMNSITVRTPDALLQELPSLVGTEIVFRNKRQKRAESADLMDVEVQRPTYAPIPISPILKINLASFPLFVDKLPQDALVVVLAWTGPRDLLRLACTCKAFATLLSDQNATSSVIWRHVIQRYFYDPDRKSVV